MGNKMFKRLLTGVLSVCMMMSQLNIVGATYDIDSNTGLAGTTTLQEVVVKNYTLSDEEKTVLASNVINQTVYEFVAPTSHDGLVTVDDESVQTIYASNYSDGKGNTFKPVSAVVTENGVESAPYTIVDGKTEFTTEGSVYSVAVTYVATKDIETLVQERVLNTPHYLVSGTNAMSALSTLKGKLNLIAGTYLPVLVSLRDGYDPGMGFKIKLTDDDAKASITSLENQVKTNASESLNLHDLLSGYDKASTKYGYYLENGMKTEAEVLTLIVDLANITTGVEEFIETVNSFAGMMDVDVTAEVSALTSANNELKGTLAALDEQTAAINWEGAKAHVANALVTSTTSAEFDALVTAAKGNTKVHEATETVELHKTVVEANVALTVVTVNVIANVVNGVDTVETVEVKESKSINVPTGATKDQILAAIDGYCQSVFVKFGDEYGVNNENFTIVTSELPETLTEAIEFTVTYTPKQYDITYPAVPANNLTDVPYGYKHTLPSGPEGTTYVYAINGNNYTYTQGDVYTVVGDTTILRNAEKTKYVYRLYTLLSEDTNYSWNLAAQKVLANKGLASKTFAYRTPDDKDGLLELTYDSGSYTLTAKAYDSGAAGLTWVPVSYTVNGNTKAFTNAEYDSNKTATTTIAGTLTGATVNYELYVSDITLANANVANTLMKDAVKQKEALDSLLAQLENLKMGPTMAFAFSMFKEQKLDLNNAADKKIADAIDALKATALNVEDQLVILEYVLDYETNGLKSFYEDGSYDAYMTQLEALATYLPIITENGKADGKFAVFAETMAAGASDKIVKLMNMLNEKKSAFEAIAPKTNLVDMDNATSLFAILEGKDPEVGNMMANTVDTVKGVRDYASVNVQAEGWVLTTVSVVINDANGNPTKTVTKTIEFEANKALTAQNVNDIKALLAAAEAEANVDTVHYEVNTALTTGVPAVGTVMKGNNEVAKVYSPKKYEVTVNGDYLATITYENPVVNLVAHPTSGYAYVYTIGTKEYEITKDTQISLLEGFDTLFATGKLNITRTSKNIAAANAVALFDNINKASGNKGTRFVISEENGEYVVVLRIDATQLSAIQSFAMGMGTEVINGPKYLAIGGEVFFDGSKLSIQTIVDMLLNSGLSMDSVAALINADGSVTDAKVFSDTATIVVGGNGNHLGGVLMESTISVGSDASTALNMPFYVTLSTNGAANSNLAKADKAIAAAKPYVNVATNEGTLEVDVTIPEDVYQFALVAMLATGYTTIEDITNVKVLEAYNFLMGQFKTVVGDEVTAETFNNTLKKLGISRSVPAETVNKVLNLIRKADSKVSFTNVVENGNTLTGLFAADIAPAFGLVNIPEALLSAIKEYDGTKAELSAPVALTVNNFDTAYDAVIVDNSKAGLGKFNLTNNLAKDLAAAGNNAIVVLLSDYEGDLTVKNGVFMDLNGKSINGTLTNTASASVKVFNSDFNNDGGITKVVGKYTITGGSYETDVTGMVPAGYVQENGTVQHEMYTLTEDASGNITLTINADKYAVATEADLIYFAVDAAIKLGVNFYTASAVAIDGNGIYDTRINDLVGVIADSSKTDLVNLALHVLDYDGIEAVANTLIEDITDFGAIATALENGTELVSYTLTTTPWGAEIAVSEDNYFTGNFGGNTDVNVNRTIKVKVSGKEELLVDVFKHLANIIEIEPYNSDLFIELNDVRYDRGLVVDAGANFGVTVDFTDDARYTTIMAMVLGYTNPEMKDAIHAYVVEENKAELIKAVDNLTTKDIIAAVKGAHNVSFNTMVKALGLTGKVDDAAELEANYHRYLNVLYAVAARIDVAGNNTKMANWKDGETYTISRENWHRMNLRLTAKLFADPNVAEPVVTPKVTLSKDNIYGFKYDAENAIIYFDTVELGISPEMFSAGTTPVFFGLTDCTYVKHEFVSGLVQVADGSERIANGAKLVVTVLNNAGKEVEFEFTVMILGDVNANGRIDSNDLRMMLLHDLDKEPIAATDAKALWAADVNGNGKVDSNDMLHLKIKTLYQYEDSEVLGYPYDSHLLAE